MIKKTAENKKYTFWKSELPLVSKRARFILSNKEASQILFDRIIASERGTETYGSSEKEMPAEVIQALKELTDND
jgi:hypothetical protein